MVMCNFAIFPVGVGTSLSPYVARIVAIIDDSGLAYRLTPMSTIIEGPWDKVMEVVTACFRELEKDCERVSVSLSIDYRAGSETRLEEKIRSVEQISGRRFRTAD